MGTGCFTEPICRHQIATSGDQQLSVDVPQPPPKAERRQDDSVAGDGSGDSFGISLLRRRDAAKTTDHVPV